MAILRLELIGGCELRTPSGQPLKLTARKARALLAFLALQDGAPQSRERLAALLWEDADTELARTSLRQALSAIRRALPESGRSALHADALQIALDPDELDVDVVRLRHLLADATSASLAIALDLYRGELLEGLDARSGAFDEWLGTERRSLRREVVVAAQKLRELCREAGDTTGEVAALTRVIALEPLNEPAYRELMEAYARSGRYTDALRQYQICRTALRRELDVAPEPATEALYRELMRRRRAASENDTLAPPQGEESSGPQQTAAPEPTPEPAAVANRALREAVVLLVNIHDLTAQQSELDPEDASELVGRIHSRADAVVREYGGRTDRLAGNRLLAVFGLEGLTGNEPERALRAALGLRRALGEPTDGPTFLTSAGVAQGQLLPHAATSPFPLTGRPVNLAQSLAEQATAGEILLSDDLRRALAERIVAEPVSASGGLPGWQLRSLRPTPAADARLPIAGRRAELALLVSLLERTAAGGRGRTILIRGEAGIGKTRLLQALIEAARTRAMVCHRVEVLDFGHIEARRPLAALMASLLGLTGEASQEERTGAVQEAVATGRLPGDSTIYASELVSAALPPKLASIEQNLDPHARERGRLEVVRRLLETACEERPVLLVIEDVHWASPEEAARLGELAAVIATHPALLVMSTRPDEDPINAAWRARARGCPVTTLDLAPLADEEARELAGAYPDIPVPVIEACVRRAEGHPLFLDQLLRAASAGESSLPGSVRALVLARVDRLALKDRQALFAASVLGMRFPRAALAQLLEETASSLDCLVDSGLLAVEDSDVVFVHALFRDAVYESLLKSVRRDLHLRAAGWYAGRDPGLRAGHLAQAGDPVAVSAYVEAAEAEAQAYRLERALEFAQHARRLAQEPAELCTVSCMLGELLTQTGHTHDAITVFREVIELATNAELAARAWLGLAGALRIVDRYDEALAALDSAEHALARQQRADLLTRIWTLRGNIYFPRGELDACLRAHEQAHIWAARAGSPIDEARALGGLGDAWYQRGRMLTAGEFFTRCVALGSEHALTGLELAYLPMLGLTRAFGGDIAGGRADCERSAETAGRIGDLRSEMLAHDVLASVCLYLADYPASLESAERTLVLARQLGARRFEIEAAGIRGLALVELGRHEEGLAILAEAAETACTQAASYCAPWMLGALARALPKAQLRRSVLTRGERLLDARSVSHNFLEFYRYAIDVALDEHWWSEARRYAAALEEYTREEPLPWAAVVIERGRVLAELGDGEKSATIRARIAEITDRVAEIRFDVLKPALVAAIRRLTSDR